MRRVQFYLVELLCINFLFGIKIPWWHSLTPAFAGVTAGCPVMAIFSTPERVIPAKAGIQSRTK